MGRRFLFVFELVGDCDDFSLPQLRVVFIRASGFLALSTDYNIGLHNKTKTIRRLLHQQFLPKSRDQTPVSCVRMMINETASSRQSSPPPTHDFDKFNFLPHVLNLLNLIQSDADTAAVSQEVLPSTNDSD